MLAWPKQRAADVNHKNATRRKQLRGQNAARSMFTHHTLEVRFQDRRTRELVRLVGEGASWGEPGATDLPHYLRGLCLFPNRPSRGVLRNFTIPAAIGHEVRRIAPRKLQFPHPLVALCKTVSLSPSPETDYTGSAMTLPAQPNIKLSHASDYRETYANSVQVRVNVWDFFLVFGTLQQQTENEVEITNFQGIYVSPQQAKALLSILQQNVAQYENAFGEIKLDPRMVAPGPVH